MAYAYPTLKTGTSQDLFSVVTGAYEAYIERLHLSLPDKPAAKRRWLEPPFVLAGLGVGAALELLPADAALRAMDGLYLKLSGGKSYAFDAQAPALTRSRELVREVERAAGRKAALVALLSHPPVMGDLAHLNLALVRYASQALRLLRAAPCRPRVVAAVDPFALDTCTLPEEGLYAGFMSRYHLGLDRLSLTRGGATRRLLRRAAWDRMPRRLLRLLSGGGEAAMVLAGGVPSTTRVLYAAREWTARQRRQSPLRGRPGEVLARLRRDPGFARFEAEGPHGPSLRRSAWRLAEEWAMAALAGGFGVAGQASAETGTLSADAERVLRAVLSALEIADSGAQAAIVDLKEELARETPYRRRFFRALAARVARERPVVLLPVVHRLSPLGVGAADAWAWTSFSNGRLRATCARGGAEAFEGSPEEFATLFVKGNYQ